MYSRLLSFAALLLAFGPAHAGDNDGFKPLFNGKDLTGWVNVNCAPGTFFAKDGMIITTGLPTGYLRTDRMYENFEMELEWMHMKKDGPANSGVFVWCDPLPAKGTGYSRAIEVQVLCNLTHPKGFYTSQGDIFSIHGADCEPDRQHPDKWKRCLPSENRTKGPLEWNHYKIVGNNGVIKLHVNGKEVSGVTQSTPRKGYLALESEGSECRFRNIKIKELASTNPKPEEICNEDRGFKNIFPGDLSAFKGNDEAKKHFRPQDFMLAYDGKAGGPATLERGLKSKNYEIQFDVRIPKGDLQKEALRVSLGDRIAYRAGAAERDGGWHRVNVAVRGNEVTVRIDARIIEPRKIEGPLPDAFTLITHESPVQLANLFLLEAKE